MDEDRHVSCCCMGQRYSIIIINKKSAVVKCCTGEGKVVFVLCVCRDSQLTGTVIGKKKRVSTEKTELSICEKSATSCQGQFSIFEFEWIYS